MLRSKWILVSTLSFLCILPTGFAEVSFQEKIERVKFLEKLSTDNPYLNLDSYRRELEYERKSIPLEKRAHIEANLLAEKITTQVQKAYELSLKDNGEQEALREIRLGIERDLELISPEFKEEISLISSLALESARIGGLHSVSDVSNLERLMLKGSSERSSYLNKEDQGGEDPKTKMDSPLGSGIKSFENSTYLSKNDVINSLVSDFESSPWVSSSSLNFRSDAITKTESKINIQLKAEFLGATIEAGPTIAFKREFKTSALIMAEDLNPVLLPDGRFENFRKDTHGKVLLENGRPKKRYVSFSCDASLDFETEYVGSGGFSIIGSGIETAVMKKYISSVDLSSRRIVVPEVIEDKVVTLNYLNQICHTDFLSAKINNNMTISKSLNIMMKNVVNSLRFSHPKTSCVYDSDCQNWFYQQNIALMRLNNTPRCVTASKEKYQYCSLRGQKGQNCTVLNSKGVRVSNGSFEFTCDKGLKCVKVLEEGWFKGGEVYQFAKGECLP
jgi:hypothetical protein